MRGARRYRPVEVQETIGTDSQTADGQGCPWRGRVADVELDYYFEAILYAEAARNSVVDMKPCLDVAREKSRRKALRALACASKLSDVMMGCVNCQGIPGGETVRAIGDCGIIGDLQDILPPLSLKYVMGGGKV